MRRIGDVPGEYRTLACAACRVAVRAPRPSIAWLAPDATATAHVEGVEVLRALWADIDRHAARFLVACGSVPSAIPAVSRATLVKA
jgi:hypothetical protein